MNYGKVRIAPQHDAGHYSASFTAPWTDCHYEGLAGCRQIRRFGGQGRVVLVA